MSAELARMASVQAVHKRMRVLGDVRLRAEIMSVWFAWDGSTWRPRCAGLSLPPLRARYRRRCPCCSTWVYRRPSPADPYGRADEAWARLQAAGRDWRSGQMRLW